MNPPRPDPVDLLARCALGDRRSFEQLYKSTSAHLYGLVLRIVRQQETANEVLQEAYVKIWHRAGDFNPAKAGALTWMGTIARNQAIDTLRRGGQQPATIADPVDELHWLTDDGPGPEDNAHLDRQGQALRQCLEQLEDDQRRAIMLAYFEGLTHEELAARMERPLGTVKSWVRRGLQRLKHCLESA
ncbi:MAG: sigma-70 family RNA polymerase sigma factor [Candidatus Competibacterales bacterium]|nr:sigma-70 family RNA polymerase sigma factor [Candidatus Competibacterales bacterium]